MNSKVEDAARALNDALRVNDKADGRSCDIPPDVQYLGEMKIGDSFTVRGIVVRRRETDLGDSVDVALLGQDYDLPECVTLPGHLLAEHDEVSS